MSLIAKFDGNMNVIGKQLRKYRMKKNLSYESLSTKLQLIGINIHRQSLYDIENNKRTVKDYELYGLAHVLEIDINEFFEDMKNSFQ